MTADVVRSLIFRRMDECDSLANLPECDPERVARRASTIIEEIGDRMARLGFPVLYGESLQHGGFAEPYQAKAYLSRCLSALPIPPSPASPYLDAGKAAAYLGITVKQLYRQVEVGRLTPQRGPRNSYLFTTSVLDGYVHGK